MPVPRIGWIPSFAIVLLASPAFASPCAGIPAQFDGQPLAAEPTILNDKTPREITGICGVGMSRMTVAGCADEETNTLYLTAPRFLENMGWSQWQIACLEKHERAHLWHVDGTRWSGDHNAIVTR